MTTSTEVLNPLIFHFVSDSVVLKTKKGDFKREKSILNYNVSAYIESHPRGLVSWSLCHKPRSKENLTMKAEEFPKLKRRLYVSHGWERKN